MPIVNVSEAKNTLSRLVDAVESGAESEVIIARNGRPAARLVPLDTNVSGARLGVARGRFEVPDSIDADDAEIAGMFGTDF